MEDPVLLLLAIIPLLVLWSQAIVEIARRPDLAGWQRLPWIGILIIPAIGLAS